MTTVARKKLISKTNKEKLTPKQMFVLLCLDDVVEKKKMVRGYLFVPTYFIGSVSVTSSVQTLLRKKLITWDRFSFPARFKLGKLEGTK